MFMLPCIADNGVVQTKGNTFQFAGETFFMENLIAYDSNDRTGLLVAVL